MKDPQSDPKVEILRILKSSSKRANHSFTKQRKLQKILLEKGQNREIWGYLKASVRKEIMNLGILTSISKNRTKTRWSL